MGASINQFFGAFTPGLGIDARICPDTVQVIGKFHQRGNRGIELELIQVVIAFTYRLMEQTVGVTHHVIIDR